MLLVVALGVAFALGRWSAEPPPAPIRSFEASSMPTAREQPQTELPPRDPSRAPLRPPTSATSQSAPTPSLAVVTPELVDRVTQETKARIEELRAHIVSRCWPGGASGGGPSSTQITLDVTFDAQGHEIARGISEDRRSPAPEFVRCLRNLEGTVLSVAPPGANVGVNVPVTFP